MKKRCLVSAGLLILQLILPLCQVLAVILGLDFALHSVILYAAVSTGLSLAAAAVLVIGKYPRSWVCLLILPAALVNSFCWLHGGAGAAVLALVNVLCAGVVVFRCAGRGKAAALILCVPLMLFGVLGGMLRLSFGNLSQERVVRELQSPMAGYTALIIDSNQGAMGGNTYVEVRDGFCLDLLIGSFTHPPERIYTGGWGEAEEMDIRWLDEQTLVINGEQYSVED